jgi:hypothetical protein
MFRIEMNVRQTREANIYYDFVPLEKKNTTTRFPNNCII